MKYCPTCHRQYEDETMKFCLDDGSTLVHGLAPTQLGSAADATLHLPGHSTEQPPGRSTQPSPAPQPTMTSLGFQPIGAGGASASSGQTPPVESQRSAALLWVVGAIILAGAAIVVALIVTRNRGENANASAQSVATASPESKPTVAASTTDESGVANVNQSSANQAPALGQPTKPKETPSKSQQTEKPTPAVTPPPVQQIAPRGPVSGGVLNGKAIYLAKPKYPEIARSTHVTGTVNVQVMVDEEGNVISARAVSGHPLLQQSAVSAARASKFSPTKISGQPVKVTGVIVYNFTLE